MSPFKLKCTTLSMLVLSATFFTPFAGASEFTQVVSNVKPSVVAIGGYDKTRSPPLTFAGTGFAVEDGLTIITNAHVVKAMVTAQIENTIGVIIVKDGSTEFRHATILRTDPEHDLVALKIEGTPLPAMPLGDAALIKEGQSVAFTGFPLGMQIGLRHVTHRAMISSITPIVVAAANSRKLDANSVAQIRKSSFDVFQLDGTAYPGNSGSPLFHPETGAAIGVINMVFVKGLKETAITNPSGIAYAIPITHVRELLKSRP